MPLEAAQVLQIKLTAIRYVRACAQQQKQITCRLWCSELTLQVGVTAPPTIPPTLVGRYQHTVAEVRLCQQNAKYHAVCGSKGLLPGACILMMTCNCRGLASASHGIWNEVMHLKATGKPVIASMGNLAASAGYCIAGGASIHIAD